MRRRRSPLDLPQMGFQSLEMPSFDDAVDVSDEQQPLTPEEEQSLLGNVAGAAEYVGESLEKPGYAVRGLMTGKPDALLNLIPFYDTIQQSSVGQSVGLPEAPKVSGWDLAEAMGAGPNQEGFDAGDIPKWGLELLTNPLTFYSSLPRVGVKAAANAAKLAAEAGKGASTAEKIAKLSAEGFKSTKPLTATPKVMADQVREGSRALAGFGLPFMEPAFTVGRGSENVAKAIEAVGYSKPVAAVRGLFSHVPGVGDVFDPKYQKVADEAWAEAESQIGAMQQAMPVFSEGAKAFHGITKEAAESLGKQGDPEIMAQLADLPRILKADKGGIPNPEEIARRIADTLGVARNEPLPQALQTLATSGDHFTQLFVGMQKVEDDLYAMVQQYGGDGGMLLDATERHTPRGMAQIVKRLDAEEMSKRGVPIDSIISAYEPEARRPWLKLIPMSTKYANPMARDYTLRGLKVAEDTGELMRMAGEEQSAALRSGLEALGIKAPKDATKADLRRLYAQEAHLRPAFDESLAKGYIDEAEYSKRWNELFGQEVVEKTGPNTATVTRGVDRAPLPSEIARDKLGAIPIDSEVAADLGRVTSGRMSPRGVDKILRRLDKLPAETVKTGVWDKQVVSEFFDYANWAIEKIYNARTLHNFLLQPGVIEPIEGATKAGVPLAKAWGLTKLNDNGLANLVSKIPGAAIEEGEDIAEASAKLAGKYQVSNDGVRILNTLKELQRPKTVGAVGRTWDTLHRYLKSYLTIPRLSFHSRNIGSGTYQNIADGMVAPHRILREVGNAVEQARTGKQHLQYLDEFVAAGGLKDTAIKDVNDLREAVSAAPSGLFGGAEKPLLNALFHPIRTAREGGFNPFNIGNQGGKQNVLIEAGSKMYGMVEYLNRAPYYEALRKSGFSPGEALHYVNRSQFDYSKASPFERNVLKKLIPFYGWVRNNVPLQIKRIIERPLGSVTGMTIKATKDISSGESEFTPDWLREGLGVKLGGPPEATAFLKQAGLPIEDLNRLVFRGGLPDFKRSTQKTAAMLSPFLLAPIETATGTQLYTGRPLKELQSVTGIPTLDSIIHYSPASAIASEAFSAIDPRKSIGQRLANALTGLKVGTYDAEKMKIRALQKAQQEELAADPRIGEMTHPYIKPQYRDQPESADLQAKMKVLNRLQKSLRSLQKRRDSAGVRG